MYGCTCVFKMRNWISPCSLRSGHIDHDQLIIYRLNTMEIPKESLYLKIKGHQVTNSWEIFTHTRTHAHTHARIRTRENTFRDLCFVWPKRVAAVRCESVNTAPAGQPFLSSFWCEVTLVKRKHKAFIVWVTSYIAHILVFDFYTKKVPFCLTRHIFLCVLFTAYTYNIRTRGNLSRTNQLHAF